jgi:hypothetical protein
VSVVANLPLLTDDDLELLFSGDSDGARRYRLLHAVLVRGMTQREAATEAHVSERTVRNVLRAYGRSGSLEVLRTRSGAPAATPRRSKRRWRRRWPRSRWRVATGCGGGRRSCLATAPGS